MKERPDLCLQDVPQFGGGEPGISRNVIKFCSYHQHGNLRGDGAAGDLIDCGQSGSRLRPVPPSSTAFTDSTGLIPEARLVLLDQEFCSFQIRFRGKEVNLPADFCRQGEAVRLFTLIAKVDHGLAGNFALCPARFCGACRR